MLKEISIDLNNILLSLSDAVDLASPVIASHQLRTAYIAWQIAKEGKLQKETIEKIYMAALLHDIGAMTPEDKIRLHDFEEKNVEPHCVRGESLFELTPLLKPAARIVRFHHRPWKKWEASIDSSDVLESQVLFLADLVERLIIRDQYILHQVEKLTSKITSYENTQIHHDVVELFVRISKREDFWLDVTSPRLYSLLLREGPLRSVQIYFEDISSIAQVIRNMIDFRSPFTATHSTGVAECASILSEIFGFTETEVKLMKLAGYFHDLGKLAIPNAILEKPSKLTQEEFNVIKQHTYFTYTVLISIGQLDQVAEWAAFHHEKIDGSGYPFHLSAEKINIGSRIMAIADIFTALAEDRPYRKGRQRKEVEKIFKDATNRNFLEKKIVNLLIENYDEVSARVREEQVTSKDCYERQFAVLERERR